MAALAYASTANASTAMHELGLEVANQRMEQARNLPYDSLGTTNGYPTGTIVTPDTVVVATPEGTKTLRRRHPGGLGGGLRIQPVLRQERAITVSWTTPRPGSVMVESNVVGKSTLTNAGDVKVNVVDSDTSAKVTGATITIKPLGGFTVSKTTGSDGFVRWGKVPSGSITITGTCPTHYLDMSPGERRRWCSPEQLNEWTIQAVRPSSGTVHVIDQNGVPDGRRPGDPQRSRRFAQSGPSDGHRHRETDTQRQRGLPQASQGHVLGTGSPERIRRSEATTAHTEHHRRWKLLHEPSFACTGSQRSRSRSSTAATIPSREPRSRRRARRPSGVTTDANGQVTSNSMGAIGANKTYTVTAARSGYLSNTGTVTLSQYTQGIVTIKLADPPPTTIKVIVLNNSTSAAISGRDRDGERRDVRIHDRCKRNRDQQRHGRDRHQPDVLGDGGQDGFTLEQRQRDVQPVHAGHR